MWKTALLISQIVVIFFFLKQFSWRCCMRLWLSVKCLVKLAYIHVYILHSIFSYFYICFLYVLKWLIFWGYVLFRFPIYFKIHLSKLNFKRKLSIYSTSQLYLNKVVYIVIIVFHLQLMYNCLLNLFFIWAFFFTLKILPEIYLIHWSVQIIKFWFWQYSILNIYFSLILVYIFCFILFLLLSQAYFIF